MGNKYKKVRPNWCISTAPLTYMMKDYISRIKIYVFRQRTPMISYVNFPGPLKFFLRIIILATTMTSSISNGPISHGSDKSATANSTDNTKTGDAAVAATAVLKPSIPMPPTSTTIRGVDFNDYKLPITVQQLTSHFSRTGFQASNLGRAIEIINNMVFTPVGKRD